jgi:hypothetical protein
MQQLWSRGIVSVGEGWGLPAAFAGQGPRRRSGTAQPALACSAPKAAQIR